MKTDPDILNGVVVSYKKLLKEIEDLKRNIGDEFNELKKEMSDKLVQKEKIIVKEENVIFKTNKVNLTDLKNNKVKKQRNMHKPIMQKEKCINQQNIENIECINQQNIENTECINCDFFKEAQEETQYSTFYYEESYFREPKRKIIESLKKEEIEEMKEFIFMDN